MICTSFFTYISSLFDEYLPKPLRRGPLGRASLRSREQPRTSRSCSLLL